jgi:hypothetical protein
MAELNILNKRATLRPGKLAEADGRPLGVCINDCEIDYGQPSQDLIHVCFSLGCAFAERRWGRLAEGYARPAHSGILYPIAS